jgi:hypothetical protein
VNVTEIHNVYETRVVNENRVRVSYNGGNGGVNERPTREEDAAAHQRHVPRESAQVQHVQAARTNPQLRASTNQGKPPIAATQRPGALNDRAVVPAKEGGHYTPPPRAGNNAATRTDSSAAARPGNNATTRTENGAAARTDNSAAVRSTPPTHVRDIPPAERRAPPNMGNPKVDQKYQQQQDKLIQKQDQERQKLQQKQEKDHQQLSSKNADDARKQQVEQQHQQQTQQLMQKHAQQQQHLQERQQPPQQNQSKPPKQKP